MSQSRIQQLKNRNIFVKREDELGGILNGSKWRKYQSFIPALLEKGYTTWILPGNLYSNHVLTMLQIAREHGIQPVVVSPPQYSPLKGNGFLSALFLEEKDIHYAKQEDLLKTAEALKTPSSIVIPQGGFAEEALIGALSLSEDILRNESALDQPFSHIFIDAGTGFTAIALLLGLSLKDHSATLHIVQMAGKDESFETKIATLSEWLGKSPKRVPYLLYEPSYAKSFGSVNGELMQFIRAFAKETGILLDPIYNAKLFQKAFEIIPTLTGNILIIHSGGTASLLGYS